MKKVYKILAPENYKITNYSVKAEEEVFTLKINIEEKKLQIKDGDFLVTDKDIIFIYKDKPSDSFLYSYATMTKKGIFFDNLISGTLKNIKIKATQEEIDKFIEKIENTYNKTWNKETKCFERWKPKIGEEYYYIGPDMEYKKTTNEDYQIDKKTIDAHNCYKTKDYVKSKIDIIKLYL